MSLKRDIYFSLILGFFSGLFLFFVFKNPYIEEFQRMREVEKFSFLLIFVFPIGFLIATLIGKYLSKFFKLIYQFIKFIEVGVLNTAVDFGILNILIWITGITGGWRISPLNVISFLCAVTNSYFWNKFWTFSQKTQEKVKGKEFFQFLIISVIGVGINTGIVVSGTSFVLPLFGMSSGAWANVMKLFATFVSMIWNFLGYKFIVFKK